MRIAAIFSLLVISLTYAISAQAEVVVPQSREQMTLSFAPITEKAAPAVVNIFTKTRVQVRQAASPFANDPFYRQFFGRQFLFGGRTEEKVGNSLGSGVIIRSDGVIVTSHHVISNAEAITVALADGREFEAKVTMRDAQTDLAFLKIESSTPLPFIELQDSDSLLVGDLVLAIGNPFGIGQTVTQGIVSALARKAKGVSDYAFFIQTDAAINPGNSGGALVSMQGKLVGINTAIYSRTGTSNGIGFAIPANMVRVLLESSSENGKVVRPWLGMNIQLMSDEIAQSVGLEKPQGVLVRSVVKSGSAARGGIKSGDVITQIGGADITNDQDVNYRIALAKLGEKIDFTVWRAGAYNTVSVTMHPPVEEPKRDIRTLKGETPLTGVTVANLSPVLASEIGLKHTDLTGVIILKIQPTRLNASLQPGDIIREVNGTPIGTTEQLEQVMQSDTRNWSLVFDRAGSRISLTVRNG